MNLPRHLSISGGGVSGIQILKVVKEIELKLGGTLRDKLQLDTISCVSIGCFIGLGIMLNIQADDFLENVVPKSENYIHMFGNMTAANMFNNYVLTNNDIFVKIVDNCVSYKIKSLEEQSVSFQELFDITKIQFNIQVVNVTKSKTEIWNHLNQPDMPISFAIQVSSCLPIIFAPILFKEQFYIDGGVSTCIPMVCPETISDTLGIYLQDNTPSEKTESFLSYIYQTYSILTQKDTSCYHKKNTIFITKTRSTFDFNIGYTSLCQIYNDTEIDMNNLSFFKVKEPDIVSDIDNES